MVSSSVFHELLFVVLIFGKFVAYFACLSVFSCIVVCCYDFW